MGTKRAATRQGARAEAQTPNHAAITLTQGAGAEAAQRPKRAATTQGAGAEAAQTPDVAGVPADDHGAPGDERLRQCIQGAI